MTERRLLYGLALVVAFLIGAEAHAQTASTFDVYGFAMLDAGYNNGQIHPDWFDVVRPTKLSSYKNEWGTDGNVYFSVRQTRFGVKSSTPTDLGQLKTQFEFELFGTGVDAGQTTFRLRHAYGELGKVGAGQTWSPFMDIDVFPNSLEYWGPNGMVFFRNVQIRWMPIQGDTRLTLALERPGASADAGIYAGRVELQDIAPRFPVPDVSAEYHVGRPWGYVEFAGILRYMKWEDMGTDSLDLSGDATGWGLNVSSNLKLNPQNTARLQVVYGEGIENYMNDAPVDVGAETNPGNPATPVVGKALPVLGVVAFLDHSWNTRFSSAVGYSMVNIDNTDAQDPSAFKRGQYALGNVLYYPAPNVTTGVEFQWGQRENFSDGWKVDDFRVQVSFKYNFSKSL
jgi:hypothetical protein